MRLLPLFIFVFFSSLVVAQNAPASLPIHAGDGSVLPAPPTAATVPVVDDYFGTKITDNYRWLEDAKSPETQAYITAQNQYTDRYLKHAKIYEQAAQQLDDLMHTSFVGLPVERKGDFFFTKRLADEDQASIYLRHTWSGKDERIIDPGSLSRNRNSSIGVEDISRDGGLVAVGLREGGADEVAVRLFDVKSRKFLEDTLGTAQYSSVFFSHDAKSLYYVQHTPKGSQLYEHTIGRRSSSDVLLFGHEFHGESLGPIDLFSAGITDDGRYLTINISRGVPAKRNDIVYRDLVKPGAPFEILVWDVEARIDADEYANKWIVHTNYKAPNWRVLEGDPESMPDSWKTIVAEGIDPIDGVSIVGGKLFVHAMHDVKPEIIEYSLAGKKLKTIGSDTIGSYSGLDGQNTERYGFYQFQSFIQPPTIYRYDTTTGKSEIFWQSKIKFDSMQYQTLQEFYTSKDGTRVPIFIVGKKGLKRDGTERLLMTGYGGFDISQTAVWNPQYAWWIENGGWFALPNLRGGGEYGEHWHQQGMFEHKQNVFDDWFAAAEYLIAQKYTSPEHFAITGRSNGGLLMGASMTQRPELFGAIACGYPLLDMLRYQNFLVGAYWTTEYGSSANEKQFRYLLTYSPYQSVKEGAKYPAIFFFTGVADTRVDPLHARKMAALVQNASSSGRPVLLHYSLSAGHSAGISVVQAIEEYADQLTFLWTETTGINH